MTHPAQTLLLCALTFLGLGQPREVHEPATPRAFPSAPLTAIFRSSAIPQLTADETHWLHTRSGRFSFSGVDARQPSASPAHARRLSTIARACAPGGSLPATALRAEAFGHPFTRHAPAEPRSGDGLLEVWWSADLQLPLSIARQEQGRILIDELVHLELEERSELLAR